MEYILVKDLNFSYDGRHEVIRDVSFTIKQGSYTTIIGENGSGKSTIAKLLVGLLPQGSGEIYIEGLHLNEENLSEIRTKVGIVFQNPDNQFIGATVADDIAFGLENKCVEPTAMEEIINQFALETGMVDYLNREPSKLSGGQKQRVAIAGVLAMAPDILIFDEATSMLDPRGKKEINELIRKIHAEKKLTIISITHDIEEAAISDHVIVLNQGKVVSSGSPDQVLVLEEELLNLQLDVPFAYKINKSLQAAGLKLSNNIKLDDLVEELCQLHSKK